MEQTKVCVKKKTRLVRKSELGSLVQRSWVKIRNQQGSLVKGVLLEKQNWVKVRNQKGSLVKVGFVGTN